LGHSTLLPSQNFPPLTELQETGEHEKKSGEQNIKYFSKWRVLDLIPKEFWFFCMWRVI
jgi:hypothetical protein